MVPNGDEILSAPPSEGTGIYWIIFVVAIALIISIFYPTIVGYLKEWLAKRA